MACKKFDVTCTSQDLCNITYKNCLGATVSYNISPSTTIQLIGEEYDCVDDTTIPIFTVNSGTISTEETGECTPPTPSVTPSLTPTTTPSITPTTSVTPSITPTTTPSITPSTSVTPSLTPSTSEPGPEAPVCILVPLN